MQAKKLKPLPKKITNEIRGILEGCRDGKLKHDQSDVHCGTAHCICGWKVVKDASKIVGDELLTADFGYGYSLPDQVNGFDLTKFKNQRRYQDALEQYGRINADYHYARQEWQLSRSEARDLFDASATFDEQFKLLEALERGERFE